jgi:hypothetical protein
MPLVSCSRFVHSLLAGVIVSGGLVSLLLLLGRCCPRSASCLWPFTSWLAFGAVPIFVFGLSGWFLNKFYAIGNVGGCDATLFDYTSGLALLYVIFFALLMGFYTLQCLCATRFWVIAGPNPAEKIDMSK